MLEVHGGNREAAARKLGIKPYELLDASASLTPFALPWSAIFAALSASIAAYPDRNLEALRKCIAALHKLEPDEVLPGNGAAELFTWAARDAAEVGLSSLPQPGFGDYERALRCWGGTISSHHLPLNWTRLNTYPFQTLSQSAASVLWITNPHNPTGQLWTRSSLEPMLKRFKLVICDEAFLPLVPGGEAQSLIPLVHEHPNLVVIRSLTKLYGIAGLRLGYAAARPERLRRWVEWRDPWPVNAVASAVGQKLLCSPQKYSSWCERVHRWVAKEGAWLRSELEALPGIAPMPSAANYLLIRGEVNSQPHSLQPLREALERHHRILLRDCRSFKGLDETWLRIGYQNRRGNCQIIRAMRQALSVSRGSLGVSQF